MPQEFEIKDAHNYSAYPNGVSAAYTYDNRGGLTALVYTDSSSAVIDTFNYTLDNVGNRLTKTDREYQYAYTYDPVYRLTQSLPTQVAQNPAFQQTAESFSYDAVGNRLTGPAYQKDTSYTQSYAYDYDNRLVSVTRQVSGNPNPDVITFKYDPFGRRIEKNVSTYENGLPTTYNYVYVYDNEDIILEVLTRTQDGNATTTTTAYTHGPGIDEPLSMTRDGQTYYYHADGLGSVTSMTDTAESVVNRYAYDSFGAIKASETVRNAYAFTGREFDSETGLYYYRARYYDSEAGRFIGKDPIGFEGGDVNFYGYVKNRVVNSIDPFGLIDMPWSVYNEGHDVTSKKYPGEETHNSRADAFRHCYTSCRATQEYGSDTASLLGWVNEKKGDWFYDQDQSERDMDDSNNSYGRQCGRRGADKRSCEESCIQAVNNNKLQSHRTGTGSYSQSIGITNDTLESIYGGSGW